jgi:hypothetical protein
MIFNPSGYCGATKTIFHHGKNNEMTINTAESAISNDETIDNFFPPIKLTTPL